MKMMVFFFLCFGVCLDLILTVQYMVHTKGEGVVGEQKEYIATIPVLPKGLFNV